MNTRKIVQALLVAGLPLGLIAAGCSSTTTSGGPGGGGTTCASACQRLAGLNLSCAGSESACESTCNQLQSMCASQAAAFQSFLNCTNNASYSCNGGTLVSSPACSPPSCMGGDGGPTDSGHPPDGSPTDTGSPFDTGSPGDTGTPTDTGTPPGDAGGDSPVAPACYAGTPFQPLVTWAPPTPLHQNVCNATQITAYINSLSTMGPWTSGNATCDACLQTDQTAAAHGPIVTVNMGGTEVPTEGNFGGCIADMDGQTAAGSCGNQFNNANDCFNVECDPNASDPCMCNVTPPGAACNQCGQYAFQSTMGACHAYVLSMSCSTELNMDGGVNACLGTFNSFLTLWCGP